MKTMLIAALALLATPAMAQQYQTNRIGGYNYVTGPNGYRGTETDVGNFRYYNDNAGNRCTTNRIGNQTYTSCN